MLSFLLCNEKLNSFLTRVRKLFKGGNYSREETINGNTVHGFFRNQKMCNPRPCCISRPYSMLIASKMLIRCPVEYLGANAVDRARQTHSSCGHLNHSCQFCILLSKNYDAHFCSSKFMILVSIASNYFTYCVVHQ